jgi:hypothetical protein
MASAYMITMLGDAFTPVKAKHVCSKRTFCAADQEDGQRHLTRTLDAIANASIEEF